MKLLVTGGAGFIGSNFVRFWREKYPKDEIVVVDALTYAGSLSNLKDIEGIEFVKGNVTNMRLMDGLVKESDLVVHFAAESHVDRSVSGPATFLKTNIWGTYAVLEAVRKHKVRMHHVSTDEVFGSLSRDTNEKFDERTGYDPRSPYSASKAASDHLVRAWVETYGVAATITNCSNNYGPYHHVEKAIPLFITNLLEGKKVPVYGDGGQSRDWLYVLDHCRAIELVIKKGRVGEMYLVGGLKKDVTNMELVKKILKLTGKGEEMIEHVKDRPGHDQKYAVDWSKIAKLGWKPTLTLDEGLAKTVEWYKQNEWWWKPKKRGSFIKYYKKQYGT